MWGGRERLGHVTRDRARKPLGQSGGEIGTRASLTLWGSRSNLGAFASSD